MSQKSSLLKSQRPLSPHLTIYRPQITSVMSILHRITGVILFLGSWLIASWVVVNVYCDATLFNDLLSSVLGKLFMGFWSLVLYYHMLNGVRHLFWDIGKGYAITTLTKSGIAVILGAFILTILTWIPILFGGNA